MSAAPAAPDRLTVLVADDHDLFAFALTEALAQYPDLAVVGRAADGADAIAKAARLRPRVVLMDVDMPRLDGIRATRLLRERLPETEVVVVSASHDAATAARARSAGARAYVFKGCPTDDIVAAAREAAGVAAVQAA